MKVLLLNPSFRHRFGRYQGGTIKAVHAPPLGLMYVAASTRNRGHSVILIDMTLDDLQPADVGMLLSRVQPDVIGIAASMAFNLMPALSVAAEIKKIRNDIPIVLGGTQCTFLYEEIMANNPCIDFIVRFEGEDTFPSLLDALAKGARDLSHLCAIAYHDSSGEIVAAPLAPRIVDLDELPMPARDLLDLNRYPWNTRGLVMTSRGCPYECAFCSTSVFHGRTMRYHCSDRIVEEIKQLRYRYGVKNIVFGDDTFTINRQRVLELCECISKNNLDIRWGCDTRADLVDEEMLRAMKGAGLSIIFFGVEAVNQLVLESVNKRIKVEQLGKAISLCKALDIQVIESFIIGLPFQTYESVDDISEFIRETKPNEVQFSMMIVYPGTNMYENPHRYGIKSYSKDWVRSEQTTPMVETEWMKAEDSRRAYVKLMRNLERDFPQPRAISLFQAA